MGFTPTKFGVKYNLNLEQVLTMEQVTSIHKLDPKIHALCQASLKAREHSYSPYSKFKVGATLQCPDGSLVSGCNVENASYGLAIRAERTAIVKAVSTGITDFFSVAISADLQEEFVGPVVCVGKHWQSSTL